MRRVKGFTLIELLVVVAIIAGLIAIMVPGLSRARRRAKNVQCAANQRAIAQAFNVYAYEIGGQRNLTEYYLTLGLIPQRLTQCPETRIVKTAKGSYFGSAFETWAWKIGALPPSNYVYGSYGANVYWAAPTGTGTPAFLPGVYNRSMPLNESIIPAFVDAAYPEVQPDEANSIPMNQLYTPACQLAATAMRRHGSTTNVAFADAHVAAVKLEDLWTLRWKSNWKRFDPYPVPTDWVYVPQQP